MFLVGALSMNSIFSGLADLIINQILGVFLEFTSLIIAVLVDALLYIFHNGMLRPIVTELYGSFIITRDLFSPKEIVGLLLNYSYAKMRIISISIMVLVSGWHLFKTYFAHFIQTEVEDGLKIAAKLMIFTALAWSAKDICLRFVDIGAEVITGIVRLAINNGIGKGETNGEIFKNNISNMFDVLENMNFSVFSTGGDAGGVFDIVKFVFILKMDSKLLKLGVDMAEKYIMLVFMIVISPIAFACGVVRSTATVLSKWVSLFSSTILYNVMQSMVMSFLFYAANFMTVKQESALGFWGSFVPDTYLIKDGYGFKFITIMYAIVTLGQNAVYLIDELGFSFLGESSNSGMQGFALSTASFAGRAGTWATNKTKGAYYKGKNWGQKGKNWLNNRKSKVNFGVDDNFRTESVNYAEDIGGARVNYAENIGGARVNYAEDIDE